MMINNLQDTIIELNRILANLSKESSSKIRHVVRHEGASFLSEFDAYGTVIIESRVDELDYGLDFSISATFSPRDSNSVTSNRSTLYLLAMISRTDGRAYASAPVESISLGDFSAEEFIKEYVNRSLDFFERQLPSLKKFLMDEYGV